jgi:hypothetical protein
MGNLVAEKTQFKVDNQVKQEIDFNEGQPFTDVTDVGHRMESDDGRRDDAKCESSEEQWNPQETIITRKRKGRKRKMESSEEDDWQPKKQDKIKPDKKIRKKGIQRRNTEENGKVFAFDEDNTKIFDKQLNIEILIKQINENPNQSVKEMELTGVPIFHYTCEHCNCSLSSIIQYSKHVHKIHMDKVGEFDQEYRHYQCFGCTRRFLRSTERRKHLKSVHSEAYKAKGHSDAGKWNVKHVCPDCKLQWKPIRRARDREVFMEHLMRHQLGSKGLWCESCPEKFDRIQHLRRHITDTHLTSVVICPECGETCANGQVFKEHKRKAHRKEVAKKVARKKTKLPDSQVQVCHLCAKQFPKNSALKYHMKSVHEELPFSCEVCGKKFSTKPNLQKHVVLHKPPTIPCQHCGSFFHTDQYLKRHIVGQHTDVSDMPFHCDQCGKGFAGPHQLSDHMNMHLGLKPYKCRYIITFNLFNQYLQVLFEFLSKQKQLYEP